MAFIFTNCPHCQNTTVMLSSLQKEYSAKGLQVLGAAFNDNAVGLAPGFVSQFKPAFPVGYTSRDEVMAFLGAPKDQGMYVPIIAFIDRKGILRNFYPGDAPFTTENQEKNLRATIEQLLAEPGGAQKAAPPVAKKQSRVVVTPSK